MTCLVDILTIHSECILGMEETVNFKAEQVTLGVTCPVDTVTIHIECILGMEGTVNFKAGQVTFRSNLSCCLVKI